MKGLIALAAVAVVTAGARPTLGQTVSAPGPLATEMAEVLSRAANGHSPTPEEIAAASTHAAPVSAAAVREALPMIVKALESTDEPVRAYALTTLVSLQTAAEPAAADATDASAAKQPSGSEAGAPQASATQATATQAAPTPSVSGTSAYKAEVQKVLAPEIPTIAIHLTDDTEGDRILTATVLGGFSPKSPAAVYPPLLAYLKRDDGVGQVGLAVVGDLLQLGPVRGGVAAAISTYLGRSDQTADSRSNLIEAIGTHPNQSQAVNRVLLQYLSADDPGLRARLVLTLPQLDLAPDVFADTKERVTQLAASDQENLQVVNAAKSVATCWTTTRMMSGCPVY